MALVKGMHITVMCVILHCSTFLVGVSAPVSHRERYGFHCHINSGRICTSISENLPDGHERSEFGQQAVTGLLFCNLNGHAATVRKPNLSRLSKVFFLYERKHCMKTSGAHLDTELDSVKFKVFLKMKMSVPVTFLFEQSACLKCCPYEWKSFCLHDSSLVFVDARLKTHSSSDSCMCCPPHQEESIFINFSAEKLKVSRIIKDTLVNLSFAGGKGFLYFPGLFRLFVHSLMFKQSSNSQGYHFSVTLVVCFIYVMCMFLLSLVILYKYRREESTKNNRNISNSTALGLHLTYFVKWHSNEMRWTQNCFEPGMARKVSVYCDFEQLSSNKNSLLLTRFMFLPWGSKFGDKNLFCFDHSRLEDCHYINDLLFSKCCPHFSDFHYPDLSSIHVYPVTRFLPDPTFDPHVDLSHVGYRLATLGALPSSVSVSRVRLADAGFYFQGRGDEVTCYSCHVRHSDWSRCEDPLDIHRELSPHCQHVLARDGELASLASGYFQGGNQSGVHRNGLQRSDVLNCTQEDSHVDDSEHSEAQAPGESPESLTLTSFPQRSSPCSNGCTEARTVQSSALANSNTGASATRAIRNGSHTVTQVASTNANVGSPTAIQSGRTDLTASSGSGAIVSSSEDVPPCLFPQPRLNVGAAVYPMYHSVAARRRSFTSAWDETRAPPWDEVVLSGMFYAGYADCVRCFFCGVGLKNWVVTDDIWTEHVRWRPTCHYLRAVKGDDFIRAIQRQLEASNPTNSAAQRASRGLAEAQGFHSESSQPGSSSVISTQILTQPLPAAVPMSSSSGSGGTGTASTTPTSIISSAPASQRTTQTCDEEAARISRASGPEHARATSSPASSGAGVEEQRRCAGDTMGGGREEIRRGEAGVSESRSESAEVDRLQVENRQLSQGFRCCLCLLAPIDTILMPCGHLVICSACATSARSCPLCQHSIQATAHVYLEN